MLTLRPLSRACGAEVIGLDLKRPIAAHDVQELQRALGDNGILLFKDADITPEQHIAFSGHFGPLEAHVVGDFNLSGHPEIFVVSNVKEDGKLKGAVYAGQYWHSDLSYMQKPSLGSLLLCHEMPEIGGDTMWVNMYSAYETLSDVMKRFLAALNAVHDYSHAYDTYFANLKERPPLTPEQRAKTPPVEHTLVRSHPVTGRKALYVNPGFTTGIVECCRRRVSRSSISCFAIRRVRNLSIGINGGSMTSFSGTTAARCIMRWRTTTSRFDDICTGQLSRAMRLAESDGRTMRLVPLLEGTITVFRGRRHPSNGMVGRMG